MNFEFNIRSHRNRLYGQRNCGNSVVRARKTIIGTSEALTVNSDLSEGVRADDNSALPNPNNVVPSLPNSSGLNLSIRPLVSPKNFGSQVGTNPTYLTFKNYKKRTFSQVVSNLKNSDFSNVSKKHRKTIHSKFCGCPKCYKIPNMIICAKQNPRLASFNNHATQNHLKRKRIHINTHTFNLPRKKIRPLSNIRAYNVFTNSIQKTT